MAIDKRALRRGIILLALMVPAAVGFQKRPGATVTGRVVESANAFLATLSADERSKCTFGFASSQRTGWSNLPSGIFQRNGLRFGDLTSQQREAALALVAAALSREGYRKVTDIMNGDEVLKNAGGDGPAAGRELRVRLERAGAAGQFASDATNTTSRCWGRRRRARRG
jgi:hypothetical protein